MKVCVGCGSESELRDATVVYVCPQHKKVLERGLAEERFLDFLQLDVRSISDSLREREGGSDSP